LVIKIKCPRVTKFAEIHVQTKEKLKEHLH